MKRLLVLGGNGYVGSHVCESALASGFQVLSLNRSGKPSWSRHVPWTEHVEWIPGDVFKEKDCVEAMKDVDCVLSTIGAFGSNAFMERMCGDATIHAVAMAKKNTNIQSFGFISEANVDLVDQGLPSWAPLYGYLHGKKRAENAILASYPETGVCLRPGFIYGWRRIGEQKSLPLQVMGIPMEYIGTSRIGSNLLRHIPIVGTSFTSTVPVEAVARTAVQALQGRYKNTAYQNIVPAEIIR